MEVNGAGKAEAGTYRTGSGPPTPCTPAKIWWVVPGSSLAHTEQFWAAL